MPTIPYSELKTIVAGIFRHAGLPSQDATLSADWLVNTEASGVVSHGLARIDLYVNALQRGKINALPDITTQQLKPAVALVDGDNGMGSVVGTRAMEVAIELAQRYGVGVASVRNSNHYGMASYFLQAAAQANCVGLTCSNSAPAMSVWGGRDPLIGTNPFAISFPTPHGQPDIVLDMASSMVALGKIRVAQKEGRSIPSDWALSSEGNPTTDPETALSGVLLPFGGAKGSALALIIECLAGILSGSAFGVDVGHPNDADVTPTNVGQMFMAFDISAFMDLDRYFERIGSLSDMIHTSRPAEGFDEVRLPGERSGVQRQTAQAEGVALSEAAYNGLIAQARQFGISVPASSYP